MNQPSIIKVAAAFSKSAAATHVSSAVVLSEMPETPRLNLPEGKISTATRKSLLPFERPVWNVKRKNGRS